MRELVQMAFSFRCARYPQYFSVNDGDFRNYILNRAADLKTTAPMSFLENMPEDFAFLIRDPHAGHATSARAGYELH